jgi:alpha-beta hydrolase superfamily lysophospholipase
VSGKRAERNEEIMEHFTLQVADGHRIHGCTGSRPPGGACRTADLPRHERTCRPLPAAGPQLAQHGIAVYAHDHRGHGPHAARHGWFSAENGWNKVVADVDCVRQFVASQHPAVPLILLGHSMGSFIARHYFLQYGAQVDGLVLSATGYRQRPLAWLLRQLARLAGRLGGDDVPSGFMARLIFGSFNLGFFPARTRWTGCRATRHKWMPIWLIRYVVSTPHPDCGRTCLAASSRWKVARPGPVTICHGIARCTCWRAAATRSAWGVGAGPAGNPLSCSRLLNVSSKVYPGGRHEMFNETNRDAVVADLLQWLEAAIKAATRQRG